MLPWLLMAFTLAAVVLLKAPACDQHRFRRFAKRPQPARDRLINQIAWRERSRPQGLVGSTERMDSAERRFAHRVQVQAGVERGAGAEAIPAVQR